MKTKLLTGFFLLFSIISFASQIIIDGKPSYIGVEVPYKCAMYADPQMTEVIGTFGDKVILYDKSVEEYRLAKKYEGHKYYYSKVDDVILVMTKNKLGVKHYKPLDKSLIPAPGHFVTRLNQIAFLNEWHDEKGIVKDKHKNLEQKVILSNQVELRVYNWHIEKYDSKQIFPFSYSKRGSSNLVIDISKPPLSFEYSDDAIKGFDILCPWNYGQKGSGKILIYSGDFAPIMRDISSVTVWNPNNNLRHTYPDFKHQGDNDNYYLTNAMFGVIGHTLSLLIPSVVESQKSLHLISMPIRDINDEDPSQTLGAINHSPKAASLYFPDGADVSLWNQFIIEAKLVDENRVGFYPSVAHDPSRGYPYPSFDTEDIDHALYPLIQNVPPDIVDSMNRELESHYRGKKIKNQGHNLKDSDQPYPRTIDDALRQNVKVDGIIWGSPVFNRDPDHELDEKVSFPENAPSILIGTKTEKTKWKEWSDTTHYLGTVEAGAGFGGNNILTGVQDQIDTVKGSGFGEILSTEIDLILDGRSQHYLDFGNTGSVQYTRSPMSIYSIYQVLTPKGNSLSDEVGNNITIVTGRCGLAIVKGNDLTPTDANIDRTLFKLSDPSKRLEDDKLASIMTDGLVKSPSRFFAVEKDESPDYKGKMRKSLEEIIEKFTSSPYYFAAKKLEGYSKATHADNGITSIFWINAPADKTKSLTTQDIDWKEDWDTTTKSSNLVIEAECSFYAASKIKFEFGTGSIEGKRHKDLVDVTQSITLPASTFNIYSIHSYKYIAVHINVDKHRDYIYAHPEECTIKGKYGQILYRPIRKKNGILRRPPYIPEWCWNQNNNFWIMFGFPEPEIM